jgi:hypothetical protein
VVAYECIAQGKQLKQLIGAAVFLLCFASPLAAQEPAKPQQPLNEKQRVLWD